MKICPSCKAENLDFKIFCGSCGKTLSEHQENDNNKDSEEKITADTKENFFNDMISVMRQSQGFGFIIFCAPLFFTIPSFFMIVDLSWKELASPGLLYGAILMIVIELFFIIGCLIFNREYRLSRIEAPARGLLVFLWIFSFAPFIILSITSLVGHIPTEFSFVIFLVILIFFSWLLFFGWFGETRFDKMSGRAR